MIKKFINYLKCEYEIFCFVESCESITNTKDYTDFKIKQIRNKYK